MNGAALEIMQLIIAAAPRPRRHRRRGDGAHDRRRVRPRGGRALDANASAEPSDHRGWTALMRAARTGSAPIVDAILRSWRAARGEEELAALCGARSKDGRSATDGRWCTGITRWPRRWRCSRPPRPRPTRRPRRARGAGRARGRRRRRRPEVAEQIPPASVRAARRAAGLSEGLAETVARAIRQSRARPGSRRWRTGRAAAGPGPRSTRTARWPSRSSRRSSRPSSARRPPPRPP